MQAVKRSPQVLVLAGSVYMKAPAYRLMTFWRSSSSHSLHGLWCVSRMTSEFRLFFMLHHGITWSCSSNVVCRGIRSTCPIRRSL